VFWGRCGRPYYKRFPLGTLECYRWFLPWNPHKQKNKKYCNKKNECY
jgi:hypothetical protein